MATITWHDPSESPVTASEASMAPSNPWRGIAMGLLGFIIGYVIRAFLLA